MIRQICALPVPCLCLFILLLFCELFECHELVQTLFEMMIHLYTGANQSYGKDLLRNV